MVHVLSDMSYTDLSIFPLYIEYQRTAITILELKAQY